MELIIHEYPVGARPEVTKPNPAILEHLGEEGLRQMVSRHYDLLRESPIRKMFPEDDAGFEQAKKNQADFMIQICGGPDYFNQHRGQPMLVRRHNFSITPNGRRVWLEAYRTALQETSLPEDLTLSFWNYIEVFSAWLVNAHGKAQF